jgi:hypothetical protein
MSVESTGMDRNANGVEGDKLVDPEHLRTCTREEPFSKLGKVTNYLDKVFRGLQCVSVNTRIADRFIVPT